MASRERLHSSLSDSAKYAVLANAGGMVTLLGMIGAVKDVTTWIDSAFTPLCFFAVGLVCGGAAKFAEAVKLLGHTDKMFNRAFEMMSEHMGETAKPADTKSHARMYQFGRWAEAYLLSGAAVFFVWGLIRGLTALHALR
jgi:hypothetical protein